MRGFRREMTDLRSIQHNHLLIADHLDDEHYTREFIPQHMQIAGASVRAVIGASGIQWPVVTMPDAAASSVNGSFLRPYGWFNGKLEFTLHYTSTVAGTANFNLNFLVWAIPKNGSLLLPAIAASSPTAPGPAVAYDELEHVYLTAASIVSSTQRIAWRVARDGVADANNNPLNITSLVVRYRPAAGQ